MAASQSNWAIGLLYSLALTFSGIQVIGASRCIDYVERCGGIFYCYKLIQCEYGCCGESPLDQECCPKQDEEESSSSKVYIVAACILGGILVLSFLLFSIVFCIKKKNQQRNRTYRNPAETNRSTEFTGLSMNTMFMVPAAPPYSNELPKYTRRPVTNVTPRTNESDHNAPTQGTSTVSQDSDRPRNGRGNRGPGTTATRNAPANIGPVPETPGPPRYSQLGIQSPPPPYSTDGATLP